MASNQFSYSGLSTYLECWLAYKFAFVDKLSQIINPKASLWSNLHQALSKFYKEIRARNTTYRLFEHEEANDLSLLLSFTNDLNAKKILTDFYLCNQGHLWTPLLLEEAFKFNINDIVITWRFDRIDLVSNREVEIIDYKSSRWTKPLDGFNFQLCLYALSLIEMNYRPVKASLYFLDTNEKISFDISNQNLEKAKTVIISTVAQIKAGIFIASVSNKCQYCNFLKKCPFALINTW